MIEHETVLAIDFGTSNSLAGAWRSGSRVDALALDPSAPDPTLMRTLLYFPNDESCFYGAEAIREYLERDMEGRLFRSFKSHLPNRSYLGTSVGRRVLPLENLIGIFLVELKKRAESRLGTTLENAVIGRPARYSMNPESDKFGLHRMEKAAAFAGFKNVQFVPEPLAAAFDYRRGLKDERIVLVGDFGGGTSDFTVIRIGPYPFKKEHVLAIEGCPLAGDALDSLFMSEELNRRFGAQARYMMALGSNMLTMPKAIIDRLNQPAHIVHLKDRDTYEFIREVRKGVVNEKDKASLDRLFLLIEEQQIFSFFEVIEDSKKQLSNADMARFEFNYPGLETSAMFSRNQFESWASRVSEEIFVALDECLKRAQVHPQQVDLVCLTGGSGQVPLIRRELETRFGREKLQTQSHFHSVLSGLIECAGYMSEGLAVS